MISKSRPIFLVIVRWSIVFALEIVFLATLAGKNPSWYENKKEFAKNYLSH